MSLEDFIDWDVLKNHVTKRTSPSIAFSLYCCFQFNSDFCHGYGCGDIYGSYQMNAKLRAMTGCANVNSEANINLSSVPVPRRCHAPLSLSTAKLRYLRKRLTGLVPKHIMEGCLLEIHCRWRENQPHNQQQWRSEIVSDQVFHY